MQEDEKKKRNEKSQQVSHRNWGKTKSKIWEEWGGKSAARQRKSDDEPHAVPWGKSQDSSDSGSDFGGSATTESSTWNSRTCQGVTRWTCWFGSVLVIHQQAPPVIEEHSVAHLYCLTTQVWL